MSKMRRTQMNNQLERLMALDAKRTQGDIRTNLLVFGKDKLDADMLSDHNYRMEACSYGKEPDEIVFIPIALFKSHKPKEDADFYSAASVMMALLREMDGAMKEAFISLQLLLHYNSDKEGALFDR